MLFNIFFLILLVAQSVFARQRCRPSHTKHFPSATQIKGQATETQTRISTRIVSTMKTTVAAASTITAEPIPSLLCSNNSTITSTPDCTYPNIIHTYCYSPPPPIECSTGSFPGIINYGHCMAAQTCYPVTADWLSTACNPVNGQTAYSTSTLYQGTLADGSSTVIKNVWCQCATDQWYSWPYRGQATGGPYCMPQTNCPAGMTTSYSTDEYCATAATTDIGCTSVSSSYPYCVCTDEAATPVYTFGNPTPTGCAT